VTRGAPGHLGPYRLLNVIHTGHASQIWQAYDDALGRMVGVKTLRVAADKNAEEVRLLRQEYAAGRDINHPRIIQMYAFDWDRGQPYLAMEWFSASNMKQHLLLGIDKIGPLVPRSSTRPPTPWAISIAWLGPPRRQARQFPRQ